MTVTVNSNGAYWQLRWSDQAGRKHVRSGGPKAKVSRSEAEEKARHLAQTLESTGHAGPGRATRLHAWIKRYLELRTIDLADATLELHTTTGQYLTAALGRDVKIDQLTRSHAQDFQLHLHRRGLSESTIAKHIRNAKAIMQRAYDEDLVSFNPFDRLKGRAPHVEQDWTMIDHETMTAVLEHARTADRQVYLALAIAWFAGLRRSEILRLRKNDIDISAGKIHVRHVGKQTSKRHARTVRLEPELRAILMQLVVPGFTLTDLVVGLGSNNLARRIRQVIADAGVEPWDKPLHTLRKNRATTWRHDYPADVVNAWLGHTQAVAIQHYHQVDDRYYEGAA